MAIAWGSLLRRNGNIVYFGTPLHVTNPKFTPPVSHQVPQVDDSKAGNLMHPNKQRRAYRQPPVAYLANDRWRDLKRARQRRVIFYAKIFAQNI